eukprot:4042464-Prymnesium_polylepis.1
MNKTQQTFHIHATRFGSATPPVRSVVGRLSMPMAHATPTQHVLRNPERKRIRKGTLGQIEKPGVASIRYLALRSVVPG